MAEREGFEPPIPFRGCRFSRPEPSTTRPPLRGLPAIYDCTSASLILRRIDPTASMPRYCWLSDRKAGALSSRSLHALDLLLTHELIGQCAHPINLAQALNHSRGVYGDSAVFCAIVNKVARQRFDIAVKDQPHQFAIAIHYRRPGISSGDVARRDEIHRRSQI